MLARRQSSDVVDVVDYAMVEAAARPTASARL
jgi:hypothetical protein